MGAATVFEDEDELMLGAVKAAHTGVGLHPHAQILEFELMPRRSIQEFPDVTPIHANVQDGAVGQLRHQSSNGGGQERNEFLTIHLARCHRKIGMLGAPKPRDLPVDPVIAWVSKYSGRRRWAYQFA